MGGSTVTDNKSLRHHHISSKFPKGSLVEVSPDEEGFKGSWYIATVIDPNPKKKPRKSYVEYQSLLDENGLKPLREYVNSEFLRPSPPPEPEKIESFELHDVIDAFYRDGWWQGVIIRVLEGSKFVVEFQNPPDVIEFGISELRVHRDWVGGKWVRPEKHAMRTTGLMFRKGKKVEVSFDKEDYRDVWFPATVLEETGSGSFLVNYQIKGINSGSEFAKVIVDFLHIRPSPPHLKENKFVLLEKVDAYIDFGWWSGLITKELADSRYIVFFKYTNNEREVNHSDIRHHMEWKDGNWFSASQDVLNSIYQGHVRNVGYNVHDTEMASSLGSSGTVNSNSEERTAGSINLMENQIEQSTHCNERACNALTSLTKETKLPTSDIDEQLSRPSKKLKEANVAEALQLTCQLNTTPIDAPIEDTCFGLATLIITNGSEQPLVGDLPSIKADNFTRGKKTSKRTKAGELDNPTPFFLRSKAGRPPKSPLSSIRTLAGDDKPGELNNHTPDPLKRKVGRPPKSPLSSKQASTGDKKDYAAGCAKEKIDEKVCVTKEIRVTLNLEHEGMKGTRAKEAHQILHKESLQGKDLEDEGRQLQDPTADRVKEDNQLEVGGESNSKRKRGRPLKFPGKSPGASVAVNQQNGGVATDDMVVKDCMKNEVGSHTIERLKRTRIGVDEKISIGSAEMRSKSSSRMKVPPAIKDKLQNGKVVQTSAKQHEKHSSKRGRGRTISLDIESPIQDPQDMSAGETADVNEKDSLKEVEMADDQLAGSMSDDQPLSKWFEGRQSPKTVDPSSVAQSRNVEQCTVANGNQENAFMQSAIVVFKDGTEPGEDENLPFVKSTSLWKTIESMEAFRKMPQKPHFRPLDSHKESSREGLAIGYMVTFASLVEKTSSLQFNVARSIIEEKLEMLLELETHGFDVEALRDRLTGSLLMKNKQEELQDQSKGNESQITEINHDKSKIDEKIKEIDKQMRKLQEERALALSTKEKKDSEIAVLALEVEGINDELRNVQREFEALVAAPW